MTSSKTGQIKDAVVGWPMVRVIGDGLAFALAIELAVHPRIARCAGAGRPTETTDSPGRSWRFSNPCSARANRGRPVGERILAAGPTLPDGAVRWARRGAGRLLLVLGMLAAYPGAAIPQASSWSMSCPPPLKLAAGACVHSCPAGYADAGRTCEFQDMSH